ncbi:putative nucleotidyltransferase [Salirhabdus euzebyi]|uniref:Putative nucleotidyltransferase n=1 Tax=Salirhabdus euzebyi TaxID=394506 RepID=A0A841Q7N6_9BACI|nr:nucleotidyltransferase domain-containing protein [Salirhabdus euzebyi]MBB6454408.1 putative nucleotidyltransferase [Salirhabdus euzebyi]
MLDHVKQIALSLLRDKYSSCDIGILAGSFVRGENTETSDLDIVLIDDSYTVSFRESFYYETYPIECFVHNRTTLYDFIESDCKRARPSLLRMVSEGIILKDDGSAKQLQEELTSRLKQGPIMWTEDELLYKRYMLTDVLDDFKGTMSRKEGIFIAAKLAEMLHEFILRMNKQWIGTGKWIYRALNTFDPLVARNLAHALDSYYLEGKKEQLIAITEEWLDVYGGAVFEGFQLGSISKK